SSQPFWHLLRQTRPQFVRRLPVAGVDANADKSGQVYLEWLLGQVDLEWIVVVSHGLTEKRCLFAQDIQRRRRVPLSETEGNVAPLSKRRRPTEMVIADLLIQFGPLLFMFFFPAKHSLVFVLWSGRELLFLRLRLLFFLVQ